MYEAELLHVVLAGGLVSRSGHDADDCQRRILRRYSWIIRVLPLVVIDVQSYWVAAGEIFLRESFVDDDRAGAVFVRHILRAEGAAADDRHLH